MKTRKTILCGILAVILALFLATCGDDDSGGNNNGNGSNNSGNNNGDPYVPEEVIGSDTYGDFLYEYGATTVTITGYTGSGGAVEIPSTIEGKPVVAIGYRAFLRKNLTSVVIPDSVISIEFGAFAVNIQLTSVTIGSSVTTIGDLVFYGNPITSVIVAPGNSSFITKNFFLMSKDEKTLVLYYGTAKTVTIPNGVTTIVGGALANINRQLTSVTIPNSVTTIGDGAFTANHLTSVTIPDSVTYLSGFDENQLTSVNIPSSVTTIGDSAFALNLLTGVLIPNSVTTIGNSAFSKNQLTSVTIGNSVTTIGRYAFHDNSLTSVTIPNSVTTIGRTAFYDNSLKSVTIGADVELGEWYTYSGGTYYEVSFPGNFDNVYNTGGAGTYTCPTTGYDSTWTKQ